MLLSINIPEQELIVNFIQNSLPQTPQLFCIAQYPNGAIYVQTKTGEHTDAEADSLLQFITKGTSGWYALSETPFSTMQQIGQTSLEMELERDYLLIKGITGTNCNLHLLIQLKPYGITKEKYLLAGQKKQFEVSIKGFITSLLALMNTDRAILKNIAKGGIISKNELRDTKAQLLQQNQNYETAIKQFIQLIINKLQDKYSIAIHMSQDFIVSLKHYNLPFEDLEENLEKHIQIELNLALLQDNTEITLTQHHLSSLKNTSAINSINNAENELQLGRHAKTYKLLDRYETAATAAYQKGIAIIGKNIGLHCIPAVTNASITDALNKQSKKIYDLFDKYPKKWPIIRAEFRSIANIVEKENIRRRDTA